MLNFYGIDSKNLSVYAIWISPWCKMLFFEINIWYFKELQLLEGDNIDDQQWEVFLERRNTEEIKWHKL